MKSVAVVILNWNGLKYLQQFLPSVVEHSSEMAEVWVVDNASTDESLLWIRERYPTVRILQNEQNFGFAKGYNVGLSQIDAEYYVLLNSDVEVTPHWIKPVIDFMSASSISACQPKILDYNRKEWFEHAGAAGGLIDKNGFPFCVGRIFNEFEKDHGQYNDNREVFWASGAALFIRAEHYHSVEGLDEDFFAHMEEIDLCWRLKNLGHKVGVCGTSTVYHVGGGTLNAINPYKTYLNFRNNLYLLVKNYHLSSLAIKLFCRLLLDGVAALRFLLEGKPSYTLAVLKAHISFYLSFTLMLKKRRKRKFAVSQSNHTGFYNRSILADFFLKKRKRFTELDSEAFL